MKKTKIQTGDRPPGLRWLLIALALLLPQQPHRTAWAQGAKPTVLVFLPIDAKSSVVEKTLQDKLPDLAITVFGRFRDFEDGMTNGKPDALLSIAPVLEQRGKKPTLQGKKGGKEQGDYVLASTNAPLEGPLGGKVIGVVDILGRDGTQTFLSGLLKTPDVKAKRVAKVEDLLPLLEFSAADGIVLPATMLARMLERTRMPIKSKDVPGGPVGLPAVAVLNEAVLNTVVKAFQKLDGPTKDLLGIDAWSVR